MGLWLFCIIGDDFLYIYIYHKCRPLIANLRSSGPSSSPLDAKPLVCSPFRVDSYRSIPVIKTDKREKKEKEKLLP